jgi:putative membrane protein
MAKGVKTVNQSTKIALIVGGIALALLIAVPLIGGGLTGWQGGGWGMMGTGMMGSFGWGWFLPVFMVLFWVLVIWAVVALVRGTAGAGSSDSGPVQRDSALEVLKRRYARGEIGREEYEEKKRDLA